MLNILSRIVAGSFVLGLLVVAVASVSKSEPQEPPSPLTNPEPAVAVSPAQPAPIVEYKPAVVKPVAKGHFEKRYIEGAHRWVWFADNAPKAKVVQKQVVSSGNCANGQCYSPSRSRRGRR